MNNKRKLTLIVILILIVAIFFTLIFNTRIQESIGYRLANLIGRIKVKLDPPESVGFSAPDDSVSTDQDQELFSFPTPEESNDDDLSLQNKESSSEITVNGNPAFYSLDGITYFDQHNRWNYCGPANLAMLLSFWGWEGTHDEVAKVVKPFDKDKSVMPYEMVEFIQEQTDLDAIMRVGGDLETLKTLISNGYPVIVEKGPYFRDIHYRITWMGHYQVLTGFNDAQGIFVAQDSYIHANYDQSYEELMDQWRSFNYTYVVAFPENEKNDVLNLLGDNADEDQNYRNAAQIASDEIYKLDDTDRFFAWFNYGTNLVYLRDYNGAAKAYDQAFVLYNSLPEDSLRPYRILWYQTGPYFAYYFTARYQDVIDLATNNSIEMVRDDDPALEESFYWRARAKIAVGQQSSAIEDLMACLTYHPDFVPCVQELNNLGIFPE